MSGPRKTGSDPPLFYASCRRPSTFGAALSVACLPCLSGVPVHTHDNGKKTAVYKKTFTHAKTLIRITHSLNKKRNKARFAGGRRSPTRIGSGGGNFFRVAQTSAFRRRGTVETLLLTCLLG